MSIQFAGIGSGLPVQDWIDAIIQSESVRLENLNKQKSSIQTSKTALNTVESKFSLLRSSLEDLTDANLASSFDLFDRKKVTSSDTEVATASVASRAAVQNIELQVASLATSTVAQSTGKAGQTIATTDVFTDLSNGDAKKGTFSIYVDGVKEEFEILETDTLQDIADKITNYGVAGLSAQVNETDGTFEITYTGTAVLGSSSDTSNFLNVMNLSTATQDAGTFSSTAEVNKVNLNGSLSGNNANLAGDFSLSSYTFKIGEAEITVGSGLSLQDVINNINSNDDTGVTARFDTKENKLVLISKDPGKTAINLEDTTGDFLEQMGLISDTGDSLTSQTLGNNALVYINGSTTALEANTNTLTGDITGFSGLTIKLKKVTEEGETIKLNIEQDTEKLTNAVEDFVNKFNGVINEIDLKTGVGKDLAREYSLVNLRNDLRISSTNRVNGLSTYDSLAMIGISTGNVGKSVDESSKTLTLDKDKFLEALQERPDELKALLVGDSDNGITGILQTLEKKVESAIDPVNGYFAAREGSMNNQISDIDKSITRETERLDMREASLTRQFNQMDQYISQMQQQGQALSLL